MMLLYLPVLWLHGIFHAVLLSIRLSVFFNVTQCPVEDGDAAVVRSYVTVLSFFLDAAYNVIMCCVENSTEQAIQQKKIHDVPYETINK